MCEGATPRLQHTLGGTPVVKVDRARKQDLAVRAAERCHRPVEQDPLPVHALGEQRGILVLGAFHDAAPFDGVEILGGGQVNGRAGRSVRGAGDHPTAESFRPHGARVLESPLLALDAVGRREQWLSGNRPLVDPIRRAGDGEVGDAGERFHSGQEDCLARNDRSAGVEDRIDRIRPVGCGEDRVLRVAAEELARDGHATAARGARRRSTIGRPAASSTSSAR